VKSQSYSAIVWRQYKKNRLAVAGLVVVCVLFVIALFAPLIANDRPLIMHYKGNWYFPAFSLSADLTGIDFEELRKNRSEDVWALFTVIPYSPGAYDLSRILERPSSDHLLGTDGEGRDVLSQIVWGSRVSLSVGFIAVGIAVIIGIFLGMLAGYYGGTTDIIISRIIEVMMCFPTFFLILAVLAFVGPSIYNIMIVIGVTGWTGVARLIRGEFLKLRHREFVIAARVSGANDRRIVTRHLLTNAISPVLVIATFGVASAILVEASLSFLGFGVPPTTPSWGSLLSTAQEFMDVAWWLTLAPGFAIFVTVTAYNLIGEGLRDAIDPNLKI
jgi:peptide/nickel transport system permease protein